MTQSIQAQVPEQLIQQASILVRDGWAADIDEVVTDALRRYLSAHSAELAETFAREDIEWGLHGED